MTHSLKFKVQINKTMVSKRTPLKQSLNKNFEPTIANSNIENILRNVNKRKPK